MDGSFIGRMMEIDRRAERALEDARVESEELLQSCDEECRRLREHYNRRVSHRIHLVEEYREKEMLEHRQEVAGRVHEQESKLESVYGEHCKQWVEEIVSRLTGG